MGCGKSKIVEPVHQSHVVDKCSTEQGKKKEEKTAIKKVVFHEETDADVGADEEKDILEVDLHKEMLATIEEAESEHDDDDDDGDDDNEDLSFYSAEDEPDPMKELDQPPLMVPQFQAWHAHTHYLCNLQCKWDYT